MVLEVLPSGFLQSAIKNIILLACLIGQLTTSSEAAAKLSIGICIEHDEGSVNTSMFSQQLEVLRSNGIEVQTRIHRVQSTRPISTNSLTETRRELSDVSILIGAQDPTLQLVAEEDHIPYLVTSSISRHESSGHALYSLNLVPAYDMMMSACKDLAELQGWKDAAVLYDNDLGLRLMGELMMTSQYSSGRRPQTDPPHTLRGWRIQTSADDNIIRETLLTVRQLNIKYVLIVCRTQDLVDRVLHMAMRLSMMSSKYSWTIANLPSTYARYADYGDTQVNMSAILMLDDLDSLNSSSIYSKKFEEIMISDGLSVVSSVAEKLRVGSNLAPGPEILKSLRNSVTTGRSGLIQFDNHGARKNVSFRIKSLTPFGLTLVGEWQSAPTTLKDRLDLSLPRNLSSPPYTRRATSLGSNVRIVTILTDPPFMMKRKGHENAEGNLRYDGFLYDMIEEIAKELKFTYELYPSPDGNYGSKNDQGEWNGMIKELMIGNASMCLGAISITAVREEAVDFTKPFKQKQFNLLMKKPTAKTSAFQFLWPLSTNVWLMTISAIFAIGLLLFVMDRLSPNSKHAEERFNLHESLFFTYGTLVGPGTEMVPRTLSGRVLSMAWWFFGMIIVSSYTANLAAFLTVTKIEAPIKNVADLAAQRKIKYGTVKNTYANSMFRTSQVEIYKKMWTFMGTISPDSMVDNATQGIEKIRNEDYAFIWDQPINDYITMNECDLWSTGTPFDEKGYGIGVPLGAAYRDDLTMVILSLQERGRMKQLEDKWWGGGICQPFSDTATARKELNLHNVAGVFYVLGMGAALAVVVCIVEFIWSKVTRHMKHMKKPVSMISNEEEHKLNSSTTDNV